MTKNIIFPGDALSNRNIQMFTQNSGIVVSPGQSGTASLTPIHTTTQLAGKVWLFWLIKE